MRSGFWRGLAPLRHAGPALLGYAAVRSLGLLALVVWASAAGRDAHLLLVSWDAQWYRGIAENGYGFVRIHPDGRTLSDYAFFPLFPAVERLVSEATGLRVVDAGLLVSWVASLVAAWGVFAVTDQVYGRRIGILVTVLWAALPIGVVQSMAYSESLFTAFAAWSLYAVLTGRWVWAGSLAVMAGLTRPTGVAVVAAVVVPAVVSLVRGRREAAAAIGSRAHPARLRVIAGAVIAPLGWLGYVGWVGARTDNALGYFAVAGRWGNGFDGGLAFAGWVWSFLSSRSFVLGIMVCSAVVLLGWLLVLCVRQRQPLPLLVFTGVVVFVALTTAGYFGSKPRYLMPAFPLLIPIAVVLAGIRRSLLVTVVVVVSIASATYGAFWLHGPGPP